MLSLAMVSFSACSAAISSSTGATILHGPHHSAQKSTSTGLSLPSTSLAKLASVTVTVFLPAMVVVPLGRARWWGLPEEPAGPSFYALQRDLQRSSKVSASQRSASIAAAAPVPAEVMAWR